MSEAGRTLREQFHAAMRVARDARAAHAVDCELVTLWEPSTQGGFENDAGIGTGRIAVLEPVWYP